MYMGDIQYLFRKVEIEQTMPNGIYIEAYSPDRISTFRMESEGRK